MKWNDFNSSDNFLMYIANNESEKETDVECPRCGSRIFLRTDIVLASYPPQYSYFCKDCGWVGNSFIKY